MSIDFTRRAVLFDTPELHTSLLPTTFTRPEGDLRVGILTLREKWEAALPEIGAWRFRAATPELQAVCDEAEYPFPADEPALFINGAAIPVPGLVKLIREMPAGASVGLADGTLIAYYGASPEHGADNPALRIVADVEDALLKSPTDIFRLNGRELRADFELLTRDRSSCMPHETVTIIGPAENLFIEEGASLLACTVNTLGGPVYIGRDAQVMEGSTLRGPIAVCEHATVNLATRVWPDTTIGPWCKVGGEINNVVFHSYSNKAHDGFLGNAVIGSWCNLGADTVASNLKNDYSCVRLYSYSKPGFVETDLQFCGLIMGDHSKAGINTMFNTATVVGVGCNIFGAGFPRTFLPSFTFGGAQLTRRLPIEVMIEAAQRMMARRHVELTPAAEALLRSLHADK